MSEVLVRYMTKNFVARNDQDYFRYQVGAELIDNELGKVMRNMEEMNKTGGDKKQQHELCKLLDDLQLQRG